MNIMNNETYEDFFIRHSFNSKHKLKAEAFGQVTWDHLVSITNKSALRTLEILTERSNKIDELEKKNEEYKNLILQAQKLIVGNTFEKKNYINSVSSLKEFA